MRGWLWDDCWLATAVARALFGEVWRGLLPACNRWLQPLPAERAWHLKRMCALEGSVFPDISQTCFESLRQDSSENKPKII